MTVAITGTNGKTTTTALMGHLVKAAGWPVVVGGNIGTPLSALIHKVTQQTVLVLEVSSYQLEGHETFHPNVGVFLNLTPDHLERHPTMSEYAAAKARLFDFFDQADTAVLNGKDPWCRRVGKKIGGRKVWFPNQDLLKIARHIQLPGEHNLSNAMAAVGAARALGLKSKDIIRGLKTFKGVAHRLQIVKTLRGVTYVNDSKSTNVDSTLVAIKAFTKPTFLILGGRDKGAPYTPLIPYIKKTVTEILTIGEAAPKIAKDLKGVRPLVPCHTIDRALQYVHRAARPGDVVLLSPACASFDQYRNYEHRGDSFIQLVEKLRP
jgi:UDP-N-acetylmuramoylalanine--D-glutamate ligase